MDIACNTQSFIKPKYPFNIISIKVNELLGWRRWVGKKLVIYDRCECSESQRWGDGVDVWGSLTGQLG